MLGAARRPSADSAVTPERLGGRGDRRLDVFAGSAEVAEFERPGGSERTVARLSQRLTATLSGLDRYRLVLIDCPPSLGALTRVGPRGQQPGDRGHRAGAVLGHRPPTARCAPSRTCDGSGPRPAAAGRAGQPLPRPVSRAPVPAGGAVRHVRPAGAQSDHPGAQRRAAGPGRQPAAARWPGTAARELAQAFDTHLARMLRVAARSQRRPAAAPPGAARERHCRPERTVTGALSGAGASAGGAVAAAVGELVVRVVGRLLAGALAGQLGEAALDLAPDPADGDAEDALTALDAGR